MKFMIGIIMPDKNCDFQAEPYNVSFNSSNCSTLRASPLKAFTTMCRRTFLRRAH